MTKDTEQIKSQVDKWNVISYGISRHH